MSGLVTATALITGLSFGSVTQTVRVEPWECGVHRTIVIEMPNHDAGEWQRFSARILHCDKTPLPPKRPR